MAPSLIDNRYGLIRSLGKGGFGETFLVEDTQLPSGRHCVLKQLIPIEDNEQAYQIIKARFQREAAILEDLGSGHNQIPNLYAYFSENDRFYLVQEYVEGETLNEWVQSKGVVRESTLKSILTEVLLILEYVHSKQIVHRDIKPENIIIRRHDHKPVLIDFGAVRETMGTIVSSGGSSSRSIIIGTPGFMPVEQAAGRPTYASDIFSLGLTSIYMLTQRFPQELETDPMTGAYIWRNWVPTISPSLANILDKAIQPNARDRFQTARQMLEALRSSSSVILEPTAGSGMPPTVMSPPNVNPAPTVLSPSNASGYPSSPTLVRSGMSDWQKAIIVGSVIGGFTLGGLYIVVNGTNNFQQTADTAPSIQSTPSSDGEAVSVTPTTPDRTPPSDEEPPQGGNTQGGNTQGGNITPPVAPPPDPIPNTSQAVASPAPQPSLQQGDAVTLVNSWLQGKRVMMAPPYSYQTADRLTTGILHEDLTKSGGSIDWLRSNNARYQFGIQRIEDVDNFFSQNGNASIILWVTEERALYINGRLSPSESDLKTRLIAYDMNFVNGSWKISDYRVQGER